VSQDLLPKVDRGEFQEVFIEDLNWLAPDVKQHVSVTDDEGRTLIARNVASYKGLRVWVCDERPGSAIEAELDRLIAKTSTDRLVIFDGDQEQVWRWPVRRAKDGSVTSRLTSHRHKKGDPDPKFAARLDIIRMPFDVVLDANAVLGKVRNAFDTEAQNESKRASKLMANMYAAIEKAYPPTTEPKRRDHEISVTLARILFLMFGDDTEMWQTDAFRSVIQHETNADGADLAPVLNNLFQFLDTPQPDQVPTGFSGFKYVNGGIFEEQINLPRLGKDFRTAILDACGVDWSGISPAIFGSMFQSVRDAETRRALGEHYTSEENILKTLNPLFLDELRDDLAAALARDTTQKKVNALNKVWDCLGDIRFMDPACGCGNFIIVAYRELRAIELQVMEALYDLRDEHQLSLDAKSELKVTLDHFYGIEIDEWPARIAETAMFMIDRQCDLKLRDRFGQAPERLPIQREAKIVVGNALRTEWESLLPPTPDVVVAGNPPFLGISGRSAAQTADLQRVWGSGYHGSLDYVTGWYARAIEYFGAKGGRFAYVSTNSITQGEPVGPLFRPILDAGWRIRFAHRTFPWTSDASGKAAVHCTIIGFDRGGTPARLFDSSGSNPREDAAAGSITPYLTVGPAVIVDPASRPLNPQVGKVAYGNKPTDGGWLIVGPDERAAVESDPIARRYLRPYVGARELLHGGDRYCLWLVDAPATDLAASPVLRERVAGVREFRLESNAPSTRQAASTAHLFRQVAQPDAPYLCIPAHVSEDRPFFLAAHFGQDVIASNANFVALDPDGLIFGLISSTMFLVWQTSVGGRLESRLRFNKLLTWNTFPVPTLSADQCASIAGAGAEVLKARAQQPGTSLAALYAPGAMSAALEGAHELLDAEVDAAFGAPEKATELERQTILFERYAQAAAGRARLGHSSGHSRGRRR
jgi:hypothetical protein